MAIATFNKIPKSNSGVVSTKKNTATFNNVKKFTEEERRAQTVYVSDSSKPDAAPVTMTLGEYEDIIAAEKKEHESKVQAAIKENSRLRAMSVHENEQHGAELYDKKTSEFLSRYKLFTPKEERMHGDELEVTDASIVNIATAYIQKGDFEGAKEALQIGVDNGLYGQASADSTYNKLIKENKITPETRIEGLKKAYADKTAEANSLTSELVKNARSQTTSELSDKIISTTKQASVYDKQIGGMREQMIVKPEEKKRDDALSASVEEIDNYISKLEVDGMTLKEASDAAKKRAGETYEEHLTNTEYGAETAYTAATTEWRNAELQIKDNEAQLFYANGLKAFASLPENQRMQLAEYVRSGNYKENFKQLKSSMDKDEFERMYETLCALENSVDSAKREVKTIRFAETNPVTASLASVFTSLIGGVSAVGGLVVHGVDNIGEAEGYKAPIDVNSLAFAPTKHATVTRGTVAGDIEKNVGGTGGKVASFLYQTGMSGVDSLAASFTGNWGGALLLGTSSASNAFLDAKERGVNDSQAIWTGLFAGVFETLFERVSIGNLNALKEVDVKSIKDILKNIGKSALVNATEEGLTEAANAISDYLINQDLSVYGSMYKELIASDITPEEAKKQTFTAVLKDVGIASAGGALMGIGFAGGTGAVNYAKGKTRDAAYKKTLSFAEQLDSLKAGTYDVNLDLYVSETPQIYTRLGFFKGPTLMRNGKISEIYKKHPEMTEDILKKIPEAFQNPLLVLKSKTHSNESVVAITQVETDKGPMIIPVWVNQDGTYLNIELGEIQKVNTNFVATAYGRNVQGLLEYAIENDGFLYSSNDKEKVGQLFALYGLQLPTPLKLSDSDIRISQSDADVNSNYTQNSHNIIQGAIGSHDDSPESIRETLSENGKAAFDIAMETATDKDAAATQFRIKYLEGITGAEFAIDEDSELNPSMQTAAYKYGAEAAKAEAEKLVKSVNMSVERGKVKIADGVKISRSGLRRMNIVAKDTNTGITVGGKAPVDENGNQIRGWYYTDDGRIHIYADAEVTVYTDKGVRTFKGEEAAMMVVFGHELTHRLKTLDGDSYGRFESFVLSKVGEAEVKRRMQKHDWSETKAKEEITCDFAMQYLFADKKTIREITRTDSKFAQKIREIIEWIKSKLGLDGTKELTAEEYRMKLMLDEAAKLWNEAYRASVSNVKNGVETKNTTEGGVMYLRADIKDVPEIVSFVKDALARKDVNTTNENPQIPIATISSAENNAINKFANAHGDGYRGKYTGGEHFVDAEHIRHAQKTHGNIAIEALRAQLPVTEDDIIATLSAIANGQAHVTAPSYTLDGNESILQEVQVNGYTLYAEEIVGRGKNVPANLEGRTIYKTPTKTTAQSLGTSPKGLPQSLSGASTYSIHKNVPLSTDNFLLNTDGKKQTLYVAMRNGTPVGLKAAGNLIFLSADKSNISSGSAVEAVNIKAKKPFYITSDNTVYKASNEDVAQKVNDLKAKGYDCFIFDYHEGDRYAVMVTNKAQIVPVSENNKHSTSGDEMNLFASIHEQREVWKRVQKMTPMQIANMTLEDIDPLPKRTPSAPSGINAENGKESRFYGSAMDSDNVAEDTKRLIKTVDDVRYYAGVSNEETLNEANDRLNLKGQTENNRFFALAPSSATAIDVAEGFILLKRYQDKGDFESACEAARKLREIGTSAGQTVQTFSILGRLTPEGMAVYAQKELDTVRDEMIRKHSEAWVEQRKDMFSLSAEEMQFINDTMIAASKLPDGREKNILIAKIASMLEEKLPKKVLRQIQAYTRVSMLLNSKTMLRSVLGNAIMMPMYVVEDFVGAGFDKMLSKDKRSGVRTKGIMHFDKDTGKAALKGIYESFDDFRKHVNTRDIQNDRFEIGGGDAFRHYSLQDFKDAKGIKRVKWVGYGLSDMLNAVDRINSFLLDMGDRPFFEFHFTNSINNQLRLNHTTEPTADMIRIATAEALQRTWQDDNAFTKAASQIRNMLNGGKSWGIGSIIVPFTKTPTNLTKALIEYSPVGLVKAVTYNAHKYSNSLKNAHPDPMVQKAFVDGFAKGVTGTLATAIAYLLANAGLISGGDDDKDKDLAAFEKNIMGIAPYSVTVNGKSYSYDWAQPVGGIFAITADYVQNVKAGNGPVVKGLDTLGTYGKAILNALSAGGNVLFEQSFLQGVSELFGYDGLMGGLISSVANAPTQAIPTALSQIAQLSDQYVRTSYVYRDTLGTAANKVNAKLPWKRDELAPVVDVLGHDVLAYGGNNAWYNVFLNPSNIYSETASDAAKEIYRVYDETGDTTIIPRVAPYYFEYKDERYTFTPHERADYQRATGGANERIVNDLKTTYGYMKLSDEDKAKALALVTDYVTANAKYEYLAERDVKYERDSWMIKAAEGVNNGVTEAEYIVAKTVTKGIDKGLPDKNGETYENSKSLLIMEAIYSIPNLSDGQRKYLFESFGVGRKVIGYTHEGVKNTLTKMRAKTY